MNKETKIRIRAASVIGLEHIRRQINNQDAYVFGKKGDYSWGVICDGCSAGAYSEVGARLLANYISNKIFALASGGRETDKILSGLYHATLEYLRSIVKINCFGGQQQEVAFITEYLLATVIGFIVRGQDGIFFSAGDGVFVFNDQINSINQSNKPQYLAYSLLDPSFLIGSSQEGIVDNFVSEQFKLDDDSRIAVCSDGFENQVLGSIWGHESELGLVRKLRVLRLKKEAVFSDDCTIVTMERIKS